MYNIFVALFMMHLREWRNWQTRTFEGRVEHSIWVQVPSAAPNTTEHLTVCGGIFLFWGDLNGACRESLTAPAPVRRCASHISRTKYHWTSYGVRWYFSVCGDLLHMPTFICSKVGKAVPFSCHLHSTTIPYTKNAADIPRHRRLNLRKSGVRAVHVRFFRIT